MVRPAGASGGRYATPPPEMLVGIPFRIPVDLTIASVLQALTAELYGLFPRLPRRVPGGTGLPASAKSVSRAQRRQGAGRRGPASL